MKRKTLRVINSELLEAAKKALKALHGLPFKKNHDARCALIKAIDEASFYQASTAAKK